MPASKTPPKARVTGTQNLDLGTPPQPSDGDDYDGDSEQEGRFEFQGLELDASELLSPAKQATYVERVKKHRELGGRLQWNAEAIFSDNYYEGGEEAFYALPVEERGQVMLDYVEDKINNGGLEEFKASDAPEHILAYYEHSKTFVSPLDQMMVQPEHKAEKIQQRIAEKLAKKAAKASPRKDTPAKSTTQAKTSKTTSAKGRKGVGATAAPNRATELKADFAHPDNQTASEVSENGAMSSEESTIYGDEAPKPARVRKPLPSGPETPTPAPRGKAASPVSRYPPGYDANGWINPNKASVAQPTSEAEKATSPRGAVVPTSGAMSLRGGGGSSSSKLKLSKTEQRLAEQPDFDFPDSDAEIDFAMDEDTIERYRDAKMDWWTEKTRRLWYAVCQYGYQKDMPESWYQMKYSWYMQKFPTMKDPIPSVVEVMSMPDPVVDPRTCEVVPQDQVAAVRKLKDDQNALVTGRTTSEPTSAVVIPEMPDWEVPASEAEEDFEMDADQIDTYRHAKESWWADKKQALWDAVVAVGQEQGFKEYWYAQPVADYLDTFNCVQPHHQSFGAVDRYLRFPPIYVDPENMRAVEGAKAVLVDELKARRKAEIAEEVAERRRQSVGSTAETSEDAQRKQQQREREKAAKRRAAGEQTEDEEVEETIDDGLQQFDEEDDSWKNGLSQGTVTVPAKFFEAAIAAMTGMTAVLVEIKETLSNRNSLPRALRLDLEIPAADAAYPRRLVDMCDTCFRLLGDYPVFTCLVQGQGCNRCQGMDRKKSCKYEFPASLNADYNAVLRVAMQSQQAKTCGVRLKFQGLLVTILQKFQTKWRDMKKEEPAIKGLMTDKKKQRTIEQDLSERNVRAAERRNELLEDFVRLEQAKAGIRVPRSREESQESDKNYDRFLVKELLPANAGGQAPEDPDWIDDSWIGEQDMPDIVYLTDDELEEDRTNFDEYPDADSDNEETKERLEKLKVLHAKSHDTRPCPSTGRELGKKRWIEFKYPTLVERPPKAAPGAKTAAGMAKDKAKRAAAGASSLLSSAPKPKRRRTATPKKKQGSTPAGEESD